MDVLWPSVLAPRSFACNPRHRAIRGLPNGLGQAQIITSGAGYWQVEYRDIPIHTDRRANRRLAWEDLAVRIGGLANTILVPVPSCRRLGATVPDLAAASVRRSSGGAAGSVPHSDGSTFSDGALYRNGPLETSALVAGSNTVTMPASLGASIVPPARFSADGRLYQVLAREDVADDVRLTVWPTIRDDSDGVKGIEFVNTVLRCRLSDPAAMDVPFAPGDFARPSLTFMEAF